MNPPEMLGSGEQAPRAAHRDKPQHAFEIHGYVPLLALMVTSLFVLDGCEAVKAIFNAGVWVGAFVMISVIAIIGGIAAMVIRK